MFEGLEGLMNTNPNAWAEYDKLQTMIKTGEGIEPGSEVEKLYKHNKAKRVERFSLTLAPEFNGTAEDLARSLNKSNDYLADPINNLISSIGGEVFLKQDTIDCLENRKRVTSTPPYFITVPLTNDEKHKVSQLKRDVYLFNRAIEVIEELRANNGPRSEKG